MTAALHVVLPGAIDDPAAPSGGNTYDRRVLSGLAASRDVYEIAVAAAWPHPAPAARAALGRALAELPDAATVLLDGLVACAVPELLEPQAGRVRLVVLVHLPLGDETGLSPAEAAELSARERRALHAAAAVVATSVGAARRLESLHDLPPGSVHVAPPGVDPAPLAEGTEAGNRLLCVAAVTPRKAQDVLVEALRSLADLPWTCTMVGALDRAPAFTDSVRALAATIPPEVQATDHQTIVAASDLAATIPGGVQAANRRTADTADQAGDLAATTPGTAQATGHLIGGTTDQAHSPAATRPNETEATGETDGSAGRVRFAGTRSGDALAAAYAEADLLVLPSLAETYGMVVTEALARGLPVLATQVEGVPESLGTAPDGTRPGALVPPGDPKALAAALRRWFTDPDLRRRWRAAARARRDTLRGWDETTRQLSEVLDR